MVGRGRCPDPDYIYRMIVVLRVLEMVSKLIRAGDLNDGWIVNNGL